jgi:hypothetical protein
VVESYMLAFSDTEKAKLGLEPDDALGLRVNCLLNESSDLMAVGWTPTYGDTTAGVGLAFEPASPAVLEITANTEPAGSYEIEDIDYAATEMRDRALHFHAFQLANHTGTFDYGDAAEIVLEYSATEL